MARNSPHTFNYEDFDMPKNIKPKQESLESRKDKARALMSIDRHRLLRRMPFIGSLLMRLEPVPVSDFRLDTASTDGDSIYVDIDFYSKLNSEERLFVLAHEAWHCALLHFARCQSRDQELFNCATDLEIHFILESEGLKAPYVLPHDPKWKGLSAEEIYSCLQKPCNLVPAKESENIKNVRAGGGFDKHHQKNQSPEHINDDTTQGQPKGIDPDYLPLITAASVERCRERVTATAQQFQKTHGTIPSSILNKIQTLLEPQVNWQELLAQFVTSCFGGTRQWLPPSRRHIWQKLYLQSTRDKRLEATVAVDTSGSTYDFIPRFFSELTGLLDSFGTYSLTVIQCDSKVHKVETFDDVTPLPQNHKWTAHGGGGTDFRPVFKYIDEHPERLPNLLIYLTDGFGNYPKHAPEYPVLWMLTPDGSIDVNWGTVCIIQEDDK